MIGGVIDNIVRFQPLNLPVGKAFVFILAKPVATATTDYTSGLLGGLIPQRMIVDAASGLGLAYISRLNFVRGLVGDYGSEVLSIMHAVEGIDRAFNISGMIRRIIPGGGTVSGLGQAPEVPGAEIEYIPEIRRRLMAALTA